MTIKQIQVPPLNVKSKQMSSEWGFKNGEIYQARPRSWPRTHWRDLVSQSVWKHLGIPRMSWRTSQGTGMSKPPCSPYRHHHLMDSVV